MKQLGYKIALLVTLLSANAGDAAAQMQSSPFVSGMFGAASTEEAVDYRDAGGRPWRAEEIENSSDLGKRLYSIGNSLNRGVYGLLGPRSASAAVAQEPQIRIKRDDTASNTPLPNAEWELSLHADAR